MIYWLHFIFAESAWPIPMCFEATLTERFSAGALTDEKLIVVLKAGIALGDYLLGEWLKW